MKYCVVEALENGDFAKLIFCDKVELHLTGNVNCYNVNFWGTENLRAMW